MVDARAVAITSLDSVMNVPRGTSLAVREIHRIPLTDEERKFIKAGVRTVIRREITAGNSLTTSGRFGDLDLRIAHSRAFIPSMELRVRSSTAPGAARRTVGILSNVRAGDIVISAPPTGNKNARFSSCYIVRKVECQRVRSVTRERAMIEGYVAEHYAEALKKLDAKVRAQWVRTEQHHQALIEATAADVFALDWIACHGIRSWRMNPWVWVYTLEIWQTTPARAIAILDRIPNAK